MSARFFMNLRYRDRVYVDEEGDELADASMVREHALVVASELITRTRTDIIRDWFDCTFLVTDEEGQTVLELPFGETVAEE
jgi:hypothetical protein